MDNSSQSILETLRTVEFRLGLKGYNVDEVDEYLEKAAVEAESVLEQVRTANDRLRHANERISQLEAELQRSPGERVVETATSAPVTDDALQRTLLLAQKFVDQTKRESETEAREVVSRAEERARTLVTQAEERARQLVTESEQRLRDEVSRLESTRARLATEVDGLSKHLDEQRARIRESLNDALKWFDEHMPVPAPRAQGSERPPVPSTDAGRPQGERRPPAGDQDPPASPGQSSQPGTSAISPAAVGAPAGALSATSGANSSARSEVGARSDVTAGGPSGARKPSQGGDLFGNGRSSD